MILYTKTFPLERGVSFSRYIKALSEKDFPNYVLLIEKVSSTENYRAEIVFTSPVWQWGGNGSFLGGAFFKECTIQHSKGARSFTLQASVGTGNLLMASLYVILTCLVLSGTLSMAFTSGMSPADLFTSVIVIIAVSAPLTLTYIRDKKFLEKVGFLGLELNKK